MTKRAFVTGVTGQDGSYLAELLLAKGYIVHGLVRRASSSNLGRIDHLCNDESLKDRFFLHWGDLADKSSLQHAIEAACPDEIYNLGAMSHVKVSFDMPEYTADVDALGTLRVLEIVRAFNPKIRFYQASTSELFGKVQSIPQTETTPFYPCSPYGVSKLYGYWSVVNYREAYDLFACNGILFNHESERRGDIFVSKKITQSVARIKLGLQSKLTLGNLDAKRDWGYAPDFVEGMWRMLQAEAPSDYVLATGQTHSVREFVERSFKEVDITIEWQGEGLNEKGIDSDSKQRLVDISPEFFRPREVDFLLGDPSKAKKELGWNPQTTLEELVSIMVQYDMQEQSKNLVLTP
ncbi:MAG: GDP-mannose 4,6-dehydratase [Chlamydiae bacterium]|nr:GDP-mannose 4,6-dehydratase [Chlamydiota bacterium]